VQLKGTGRSESKSSHPFVIYCKLTSCQKDVLISILRITESLRVAVYPGFIARVRFLLYSLMYPLVTNLNL
jgi:hypothetical protein